MDHNLWNLITAIFHLERRAEQLTQEVSQATYHLRDAKAKQLEYSGSFRSFLDILSGKQEARSYELHSTLSRAEARLTELKREQGDVSLKLEETRSLLNSLPPASDPRGEARYCIACLTVTLPEADAALTAMGVQMRGAVPGQIITPEQRQQIYGEADRRAMVCANLLQQLEGALSQLSIPFELPACYLNPVAYLANATEYTRRDRLNKLIHQTNQLRNKLPALLSQLE